MSINKSKRKQIVKKSNKRISNNSDIETDNMRGSANDKYKNNGDNDYDTHVDSEVDEHPEEWEEIAGEGDEVTGEEEEEDIGTEIMQYNEVGDAGDDDCSYNASRRMRGIKKVSANIDKEDEDDEGADINIDENILDPGIYVKPEDRRTSPHLTLYEKVRMIGDRTAQLAQGAKPMIKGVEGMDPRTVAQLELEAKVIPIKIIRPLPNSMKEIWSISELKLKKKYIVYGFTGIHVDRDIVEKMDDEYKKGGSIVGYSQFANETMKKMKQMKRSNDSHHDVIKIRI